MAENNEQPKTNDQDHENGEYDGLEYRELDLEPIDLPDRENRENNGDLADENYDKQFDDSMNDNLDNEYVDASEEKEEDDELEEGQDDEYVYDYPDNAFAFDENEELELYEPVKTKYPLFNQQHNTCGLSSMLMLLDPPNNMHIKSFLDEIWKHVKTILLNLDLKKKEFEWSHALEYLLLKSYHENILSEYIMEHKEFADDYYINRVPLEVHLRQMQEKHYNLGRMLIYEEYQKFFDTGIVNHFILTDQINQMKDAKEMELLFSLFGYDFVPQYSPDGTGGIFFTRKELKNQDLPSVAQRLKKLEHEFNRGGKIMLGMYHHWLAVSNIGKNRRGYFIVVNDPNTARRYRLPLKKLRDTDRFYIFKKREEDILPFWQQLKAWLTEEIKQDILAFSEFKKKLQENLKKRLQLEKENNLQKKKNITVKAKQLETVDEENLTAIPITDDTEESELEDLSVNQVIIDENRKPLSGEAFMDNIRKIIRSNFSDYSRL